MSVTVAGSVTAFSESTGRYPAVDRSPTVTFTGTSTNLATHRSYAFGDAANVCRIVNGNVYQAQEFSSTTTAGDAASGEVGSHFAELSSVQICHFRDGKNRVGDYLGRVDLAAGVGGTH